MSDMSARSQKLFNAIVAQYSNDEGHVTLSSEELAKMLAPKTKRVSKRDPHKPTAPRTAFSFWSKDYRDTVIHDIQLERATNQDGSVDKSKLGSKVSSKDLNFVLNDMWKSLSEEDKNDYKCKAKEDRIRYNTQMKVYRDENDIPKPVSKSSAFVFKQVPETPMGWSDSQPGYIEGSPIDPETGKKITKGFHNFDEAVAEAIRLGAGGITKTRVGFKIRTGNTISISQASRAKGEISWLIKK